MDRDTLFDRRAFLRTSGGVAVGALLAGCSEGGGDGDEPADEPGDEESGDGADGGATDNETDGATDNETDGEATDNETDGATGNETDGAADNETGGDGGGSQVEVIVGPDNNFVFEPEEMTVEPGTTVRWIWDSDVHNIAVLDQPGDANWEGHPEIEDTGYEYEHTFEVAGEYHYVCEPHEQQGMEGWVIVEE